MPFQVDGATSGDSMPETPADGEFRDMVTFEHTFVAAKGDDTLVNPAPFEYKVVTTKSLQSGQCNHNGV